MMVEDVNHKNLFKGTGCLATFSAKITMCFGLGLISKDEKQTLNLVRKIRNIFAHDINTKLTFKTNEIADRTKSLALLDLLKGKPILAKDNNSPRWRFILAVGILATSIKGLRTNNTERMSSPIDLYSPE